VKIQYVPNAVMTYQFVNTHCQSKYTLWMYIEWHKY